MHAQFSLTPSRIWVNLATLKKKKKSSPSTAENTKMDTQMDIHGQPDGYLGSAGGKAWPFLGWYMKEKE